MSRSIRRPTYQERVAEAFVNDVDVALITVRRRVLQKNELEANEERVLGEWWAIRNHFFRNTDTVEFCDARDKFQTIHRGEAEVLAPALLFIDRMFDSFPKGIKK